MLQTLPICTVMAPRIPSNYGPTINNQTKHCETWPNLNTIDRDCTNICSHRNSIWPGPLRSQPHIKAWQLFFSNMKAATIAPETNMFPANRNGRRKKKKRHLLLGFRCCWSEWVTVFSQGYEAEVILHNGWTSKGVTWKKKSNLTGRLVVKIKKKHLQCLRYFLKWYSSE